MRIAFTGGGTGGHVYPVLEIARIAMAGGHEAVYFGSLRGQESAACRRVGIEFHGFPSEPLVRLATPSGAMRLLRMARASAMARRALRAAAPQALFSTGGYSAAPVVRAARSLGIPFVLFEANSVPGRSNAIFALQASAVAVAFDSAKGRLPGANVVRTGMPIRAELREAAVSAGVRRRSVLVAGGSLGSAFLNKTMPSVARLTPDVEFWHVAGRGNCAAVSFLASDLGDRYRCDDFLEAGAMAEAYATSGIVVGRSGGSIAEFALFGLPSVLIPLPTSAGDHQDLNAADFEARGAAVRLPQSEAHPHAVAQAILYWLDNEDEMARARQALAEFDSPDAAERIFDLILKAAGSHAN